MERELINRGWEVSLGLIGSFTIPIIPIQVIISPALVTFQFKCNGRIDEVMKYEREFKMRLGENVNLKDEDGYINLIVPKEIPDKVLLKDMLQKPFFNELDGLLKIAVGERAKGGLVVGCLEDWESILIAGQTRSGKSNFLHIVIHSLIHCCTPEEVKFVMMDFKEVELPRYENICYLEKQIVYKPKDAIKHLEWLVKEMERRFSLFRPKGVSVLEDYNNISMNKLHHIVVVIDEFQMLTTSKDGKEAEEMLIDIASRGCASGIHLVVATQKPNKEVLNTRIKTNLLTRISFAIQDLSDSVNLFGNGVATDLIGKGDMYLKDFARFERIQACFIPRNELNEMCNKYKDVNKFRDFDIDCYKQLETNDIPYIEVDNLDDDEFLEPEPIVIEEVEPIEEDDEFESAEDYRYFYRGMKYCYEEDNCNYSIIYKHLHKEKAVGKLVIKTAQDLGVISKEKVGTKYEFLITFDEFKERFKEV